MPRPVPLRTQPRRRQRPGKQRPLLLLLFSLALGLGLISGPVAHAQAPSPNQPLAIDSNGMSPLPCPLVVPVKDYATQPLRIQPAQVAGKNAMGCLSPADAVYGPDGCPVRLCTTDQGSLPLPAGR